MGGNYRLRRKSLLPHEEKEFYTIKEFAARLGVHWFTVWRWTVDKRIAYKQLKVGGKILIPASELERLQPAETLHAASLP